MVVVASRSVRTPSVRELIDAKDWAATPLGPRAQWPAVLRHTLSLAQASGFPIVFWWGPEYIQLYNEAYLTLIGDKHPAALGQPAAECWHEVWDMVGPIFATVRETGESYSAEDMLFKLYRGGVVQDRYFTFSYSLIEGDGPGDECGVLNTVMETTKNVTRERNFRLMADTVDTVIYAHSADGTIEWANSRWYEYSRLPPEIATTPEGWRRVMPEEDHDRLLAAMADAFRAGEAYECEIRIKPDGTGDDRYRWFVARANPMRAEDGTIARWAGSATDVHDGRVAAERLRGELDREHRASRAFQEAALPQDLPTIPGLALSAVYEPAGAEALVGGDWFDAFRLPDGRVVLSVGDVIGSGLPAAVTMAGVRQAIRGAAHVYPDPTTILDAADHALRSEQPDRIVTAFVGVLDPLTLSMDFASAGHPSPLVRRPDGTIDELSAVQLPLGLRDNHAEHDGNATVVLGAGSLIIFYTDGLTEATRDPIEGERRLREALENPEIYESNDPAGAIRKKMLATASDDVAILAVRIGDSDRAASPRRWSFLASDAETAMRTRRQIGTLLEQYGASIDEAADAELIFGELLGNIVRHTDSRVEAALDLTGDAPVLHVLDRGPGFTFFARLPKDHMSESGRGLFIASMLARDLSVVPRTDGGSHARVVLASRRHIAHAK